MILASPALALAFQPSLSLMDQRSARGRERFEQWSRGGGNIQATEKDEVDQNTLLIGNPTPKKNMVNCMNRLVLVGYNWLSFMMNVMGCNGNIY